MNHFWIIGLHYYIDSCSNISSICQDTHLVRTSYVPHRMRPPWRHAVLLSALAPLQVQQMFLGRTDEKLLNFDTKSVLNACKCQQIASWHEATGTRHGQNVLKCFTMWGVGRLTPGLASEEKMSFCVGASWTYNAKPTTRYRIHHDFTRL